MRSLVQDKALRRQGLHKGVACLARAQGQPLDRGLALLVRGHVGHDLTLNGLDRSVRGDDVLLHHHVELGSRQGRPALRRLGQLGRPRGLLVGKARYDHGRKRGVGGHIDADVLAS